jgi:YjgF/chorismate_mutase-like, putative endoribonuclease
VNFCELGKDSSINSAAALWLARSFFATGHGRNMDTMGVKGKGKVGKDLTVEEGNATARAVACSILSSLEQELGDLDRIKRVIRLFGMVNVQPGFDRMPEDRRRVGLLLRGVRPAIWKVCPHRRRHGRVAPRHTS